MYLHKKNAIMNNEKIYIQNTTFEKEYGEVVENKEKSVIVKLFYKKGGLFPEDTEFTRCFSKKTGKAYGYNLKILW